MFPSTVLLEIESGANWIVAMFVGLVFLISMAIFGIVFYITRQQLNKKIDILIEEKNALLEKLSQRIC